MCKRSTSNDDVAKHATNGWRGGSDPDPSQQVPRRVCRLISGSSMRLSTADLARAPSYPAPTGEQQSWIDAQQSR
ncbi:hypothetical protein PG994_000164 [Apiospora phragmitis]|uniref:Uncharacterized protein n=1 Tax=Apiospora phragmitis TaxID=2905665 RepID=A0ABR1X5M6_9PEZI